MSGPDTPAGGGTAPEPFDLFLASLGTCAGLYALRFCQQREIATQGLGLTLTTEKDSERKRLALVRLEIELPDGFPEKYHEALIRSVDQCAVKRHILAPPRFEVVTALGRLQPETVEMPSARAASSYERPAATGVSSET